jgi:hypothetical protein
VLQDNYDGTYTAVGSSDTVTAAGGVQTFKTHVPVASRSYHLAIELRSGAVGTAEAEDTYTAVVFEPALSHGETRAPVARQQELMLAASAEPDADRDGKADETEDDCVFECGPGPGDPGGGPGGGGDPGGGSGQDEGFFVDGRGLLQVVQRKGRRAYAVRVYIANKTLLGHTGRFTLKQGSRSLSSRPVDVEAGDRDWVDLAIPRRVADAVQRRKSLKLKLVAKLKPAGGAVETRSHTLKVLRGGDSRYDGTYRGPGPLVLVVRNGVLVSVSTTLNLYCTRSARFMFRTFTAGTGFPALVARDGSFNHKASASTDSMTYRGKLRRTGTSKGYLSLFHTELGLSDGRLTAEECFQAKKFKVKRTRR